MTRHSHVLAAALFLAIQPLAWTAPAQLFASTLGGSQWDTVRALTADSAQNIYVVGETYSPDFPGPSSISRLSGDAFLVKIDPTGAHILFAVILSGSGYDSARGVAVDSSGNIYVTGVTSSSDFPTTSGSYQRTLGSPGFNDAFVVKINSSGSIVYSTYLGGNSNDTGSAIAIDSAGAAYIAGSTDSTNFPTSGAPQSHTGGSTDCFVSKLNPAGSALLYSTYLGGESIDLCRSIAVDSTGAAFVTGTTKSAGFPVASPLQNALNGSSDAFLTKLNPSGAQFVFSTYLGGEGMEDGNVVRLDSAGVAYVGGDTGSVGFPVTAGAYQNQSKGLYDGFVCGIANNGSSILFATYYGGSGTDSINDLFIAQNGRIVVTGQTASSDLPLATPLQGSFGGTFDAFAAVLGPGAGELFFSTYLGGGGDDRGNAIAPFGAGQFVFGGQILAGSVASVSQLYGATPSSQYDGFVSAIAYEQPLRFISVAPCRVADTRVGTGTFGVPSISANTSRDFPIPSSTCGIPSTAQAYSLNITVVPHASLGYLTIWPTGQAQPVASLLNSLDGRIKANAAIVPAGKSGGVSIYVTDTADVIIDINGYFVPASNSAALAFYSLTPCRVADTRLPAGPLGGPAIQGSVARSFPFLSATACNIPSSAQAYSLNFTAIPPSSLAYLTIWPTAQSLPLASTLNDATGTVVASAAFVPAGGGGAVSAYASNTTNLAADINGYFAPVTTGALSFYTVTPCRVFDSRTKTPPSVNGTLSVNLTGGACGVPTSAQAFVLNVTVVPIGSLGFLTLWPHGQTQPGVSTLNALDGALTSNMAIVPTTDGLINIYTTNPAYVILDISGYFAPYTGGSSPSLL